MNITLGYSGEEYTVAGGRGPLGVGSENQVLFFEYAFDFAGGDFFDAIALPGNYYSVYEVPDIVTLNQSYVSSPRYYYSYTIEYPNRIISLGAYSGYLISGSEIEYIGERYYPFTADRAYDFVIENSGACSLNNEDNYIVGKTSLLYSGLYEQGTLDTTINFYEVGGSEITGSFDLTFDFKRGRLVRPKLFSGNLMISGAHQQVSGRLLGKNYTDASPIFSTQDHTTPNYVRNTGFWATGYSGLSAISPWNANKGSTLGVTLVTPRHVIGCNHSLAPLYSGNLIRFVDDNNNVVEATSLGYKRLSNGYVAGQPYVDLAVAVLDRDITGEGIYPVRVAGPSLITYGNTGVHTGAYISGVCVPLMGLNQYEKGYVQHLNRIDLNTGTNICTLGTSNVDAITAGASFTTGLIDYSSVYFDEVVSPVLFGGWSAPLIGGDSGNPVFFPIDDELVLVTVWWHSRSFVNDYGGDGSYVGHFIDEINAAIANIDIQVGDITNYTVNEYVPTRPYYSYPV